MRSNASRRDACPEQAQPMSDPTSSSRSLLLLPGAVSFVPAGWRLRTLLGSCVAVVVWQPRLRVGGMCHYLLPELRGARVAGAPPDGRFAPDALHMLLQQMRASGSAPSEFAAHIAGGSHCVADWPEDDAGIGRRNAAAAAAWCQSNGLTVRAAQVGGRAARRVEFDSTTGVVTIRANEIEAGAPPARPAPKGKA
jgi:chemotaxis protein CheD